MTSKPEAPTAPPWPIATLRNACETVKRENGFGAPLAYSVADQCLRLLDYTHDADWHPADNMKPELTKLLTRPAHDPTAQESNMTEEQIKHMVDRFLGWRLPADFYPDAGISFTRPNYHPSVDATPSGTNLFTATQAEAMVKHMVSGMS